MGFGISEHKLQNMFNFLEVSTLYTVPITFIHHHIIIIIMFGKRFF